MKIKLLKLTQSLVLLACGCLMSLAMAAESNPGAQENKGGVAVGAHARVEEARKKLDAAAAELSRAVAIAYAHPDPKGERAFLGILLDDHYLDSRGVRLSGVAPGGGAALAGLAAGDVITKINTVQLSGESDPGKLLLGTMDKVKPGETIQITYERSGKEHKADVTTTGMFRSALASIEPKLTPWIEEQGIRGVAKFMLDPERSTAVLIDMQGELASYFGVKSGALVLHTPDHKGGLQPGDVLLDIDARKPANANDAQARLFEGEQAKPVRVHRHGDEKALEIDPKAYRVEGQTRVFVYRFDDLVPPSPPPKSL